MFMHALVGEISAASRGWWRTPLITAAALLTLGLGTGATTLLFALLYGVVQRPLPYPDPQNLVQITSAMDRSGAAGGFSLPEVDDWQIESRSYSALAAFSSDQFSITLPGGMAEPLQGAVVSSRFFEVLGDPMAVGRPLRPGDAGSPSVVISERLWTARLGRDPSILGRSLLVKGEPFTIVGVAGAALTIPHGRTDLWLPLEFRRLTAPPAWGMRGFRAFSVIGRLEHGVSRAAADEEAQRIVNGWRTRHARFGADLSGRVVDLRTQLYGAAAPGLWLLFACVAAVMLVATLNVAGLLIARHATRLYETAVRRALGATPAWLWRQSVIEAAILAAGGAIVGLALAGAGLRALAWVPSALPRLEAVTIDGPVLVLTLAITVSVTLVLGVVLGRGAARTPAAEVLRYGRGTTRGRHRLQQMLVVSQIGLSFALGVASLLLTEGLRDMLKAGTGLPDGRVLTLTMAGAPRAFLMRVLPDVAALPGVRAVGVTSSLPPHLSQMQTTITPPAGAAAPEPVPVDIVAVSPGALAALGLTLLEGRFFSDADLESRSRSFVISARAAAKLFPGVSPVGRALPFGPSQAAAPPPVVIGVVDDVRFRGLGASPEGTVYLPYTQRTFDVMHLAIRSESDSLQLAAAVREVIQRADPYQAVADARSLDALVSEAATEPRLRLTIVGALAGLALLLAGVGVHGVIAQSVGSRGPEFAVRAALGASPARLRTHVLAEGMRPVLFGLGFGLLPAHAVALALPAASTAVGSVTFAVYVLAGLPIAMTGLLAIWPTAYRAANRSPAEALRSQAH